jgi:hypothetical protein
MASNTGASVNIGISFQNLISYRVSNVNPSFKVEEAAVGTGDKCGAMFINRKFKERLKTHLAALRMDKSWSLRESFVFGAAVLTQEVVPNSGRFLTPASIEP